MKKRVISFLLVISMILTLFAGCTNDSKTNDVGDNSIKTDNTNNSDNTNDVLDTEQKDGGTLVWNMGKEPKAWDPSIDDSGGSTVIGNIFEGLMRDKMDGTIDYGQAKEYKISEDGLTYTFYLKDGITWSDGKPVTAYDFEYAWRRVCDPKAGSAYSYMATSYIKNAEKFFNGEVGVEEVGIKAIDEKTFEVNLITPVPFFLNLTTFFTFMPVRQDIVEKNGDGWEKNPETCIVNGPFKIEEYKIGSHIMFAKNENYYEKDTVKIDKIKAVIINEATTALNAFEGGDVHVNSDIPAAELPRLIAEEPNLVYAPRMATEYVIFNVDVEPTNDPRVRKALSLAIDRKAICEAVLKGGQTPATGIIPPVLVFSDGTGCRELDEYNIPVPEYEIDPNKARIEEAQKLLAEAGYPNGEGFPKLQYSYSTSESRQKVAEAIQEMWKNNLNIEIELANKEWQVLVDERKRGEFVFSTGNWIGDYVDPMTFFDAFGSMSGWNECQWRWQETSVAPNDKTLNPENKLFEEAVKNAQLTSGKERDKYLKEAEDIMMNEMVVAPIYYLNYCYLVDQAKVKNVWRNKVGEFKFYDVEIIK